MEFGTFVREKRLALAQAGKPKSLRRFASELGIEPAYLSKIERGIFAPPSEELIGKMADGLGENRDVMLALGGKVSSGLKAAIMRRPELIAELIREADKAPDDVVSRMARAVRDGDW